MILDNIEAKSEKAKKSDQYLMEMTDKAITELVVPKVNVQKAYNYYHGTRDPEQFRHLEDNYGIGNPTSVEFTPLVKKHVDVLVGEFLDVPLKPRVTCKDKDTLSNINRDKQVRIYKAVLEYLKTKLNNDILSIINKDGAKSDAQVQRQIDGLIEDINDNFISEYEIAAQNVIRYVTQNTRVDFQNKVKNLLLDLLISGMAFYRVRPSQDETNIDFEVLNPLQVFTDYNPEASKRCDDYRAVVVKYMTKSQILNKYGHLLTQEDIDKLSSEIESYMDDTDSYYVQSQTDTPTGYPAYSPGLISYKDITPGLSSTYGRRVYDNQSRMLPVYEVEWLVTNKVDRRYVMDRYKSVKIGSDIYILTGKDESVVRSHDDETYCGLSINGIYFQDRNSEPFSLMLACANLQDKYDVVTFLRDNLLANSGTVGDWVDVSQLPSFLGAETAERVQKFLAYKKGGVALIDTSQEGRPYQANTIYGGFDNTVKYNAIQALEAVLVSIETTCSSITGVFRERINGIEQKDAVANVAVGARNSYNATRQYYHQMDLLMDNILTDVLNTAKVVYKNGITGSIILGEKQQQIFTALPEHFTVTDFDVSVISSSDLLKQIQDVKLWTLELIKSQQVPVDLVIEAITSNSLTDMKQNVLKALKKQKEENNVIQQLQQQNEQLQQQLEEIGGQLKQAQSEIQKHDQQKLQIEKDKNDKEDKRKWFELKTKKEFDLKALELKEKQVQAEVIQLVDDNNKNDEVKNII